MQEENLGSSLKMQRKWTTIKKKGENKYYFKAGEEINNLRVINVLEIIGPDLIKIGLKISVWVK